MIRPTRDQMPLDNQQLAAVFEEIATLLEAQGANPFRVKAYRDDKDDHGRWTVITANYGHLQGRRIAVDANRNASTFIPRRHSSRCEHRRSSTLHFNATLRSCRLSLRESAPR